MDESLLGDQSGRDREGASPGRGKRSIIQVRGNPGQIGGKKFRDPDPLQRDGRGAPLRHPRALL